MAYSRARMLPVSPRRVDSRVKVVLDHTWGQAMKSQGAGHGARAKWTDCDVLALGAPSVDMLRTEVRSWMRVWTRCGTGAGTSLLREAARGRAKDAGMMSGGAACMAANAGVHLRWVTGLCIALWTAAASVLLHGLTSDGSGGAALVRLRSSFALSAAQPPSCASWKERHAR